MHSHRALAQPTPTCPDMRVWLKLGSCASKGIRVTRELFNPKHLHSRQVLQQPSRRQGEQPVSNTQVANHLRLGDCGIRVKEGFGFASGEYKGSW